MNRPLMESTAPLMLTDDVTIANSGNANADASALSSPQRQAMWIDQINWTLRTPTVFGQVGNLGLIVSTKLTLGRIAVSKEFIPIAAYATDVQFLVEAQTDSWVEGTPGVMFSHYRWKLPKPLFVPPGMQLTSEFSRGADGFSGDITVSVAYAGRYAPEAARTPRELDVPFVTSWQSPVSADITSPRSGELDLVNPFLVPIKVQRLLGRVSVPAGSQEAFAFSQQTPQNNFITIKDSYGYTIVRDFAGFSSVFDVLRRAWTFNKILGPKERYYVIAQNVPAGYVDIVTIIGTRKEVMS